VESIRYLALGDSYTIGTGLDDEAGNFPSLLARRLKDATGIDVALVNQTVDHTRVDSSGAPLGQVTNDQPGTLVPALAGVLVTAALMVAVNVVAGRAAEARRGRAEDAE